MGGRKSKRTKVRSSATAWLSSAEEVASIEDLLREFLCRLPPKALIKFQSVSKKWMSLISDPKFARCHARRSIGSQISGLYLENQVSVSLSPNSALPLLTFPDVDVEAKFARVVDSCNGLLLIKYIKQEGCWPHNYLVCNPVTKRYVKLPDVPRNGGGMGTLAFDPEISPFYKVVEVLWGIGMIYIYSQENKSWKLAHKMSPQSALNIRTAYWDGGIRWVISPNVHFQFDVKTESMKEIQLPLEPKILGNDKIRYFGVSKGNLLLIQTASLYVMNFKILEMQKGFDLWTVKRRVNLRHVFPKEIYGPRKVENSILCVSKGLKEKEYQIIVHTHGKIISYRSKKSKIKLKLIPGLPHGYWHCYGYQFIESLAPV